MRVFSKSLPNETEADPLFGGLFIGDYFEIFAHQKTAWVHYNANYRKLELLGEASPSRNRITI